MCWGKLVFRRKAWLKGVTHSLTCSNSKKCLVILCCLPSVPPKVASHHLPAQSTQLVLPAGGAWTPAASQPLSGSDPVHRRDPGPDCRSPILLFILLFIFAKDPRPAHSPHSSHPTSPLSYPRYHQSILLQWRKLWWWKPWGNIHGPGRPFWFPGSPKPLYCSCEWTTLIAALPCPLPSFYLLPQLITGGAGKWGDNGRVPCLLPCSLSPHAFPTHALPTPHVATSPPHHGTSGTRWAWVGWQARTRFFSMSCLHVPSAAHLRAPVAYQCVVSVHVWGAGPFCAGWRGPGDWGQDERRAWPAGAHPPAALCATRPSLDAHPPRRANPSHGCPIILPAILSACGGATGGHHGGDAPRPPILCPWKRWESCLFLVLIQNSLFIIFLFGTLLLFILYYHFDTTIQYSERGGELV